MLKVARRIEDLGVSLRGVAKHNVRHVLRAQ